MQGSTVTFADVKLIIKRSGLTLMIYITIKKTDIFLLKQLLKTAVQKMRQIKREDFMNCLGISATKFLLNILIIAGQVLIKSCIHRKWGYMEIKFRNVRSVRACFIF